MGGKTAVMDREGVNTVTHSFLFRHSYGAKLLQAGLLLPQKVHALRCIDHPKANALDVL